MRQRDESGCWSRSVVRPHHSSGEAGSSFPVLP
jgi:hypothetical protein